MEAMSDASRDAAPPSAQPATPAPDDLRRRARLYRRAHSAARVSSALFAAGVALRIIDLLVAVPWVVAKYRVLALVPESIAGLVRRSYDVNLILLLSLAGLGAFMVWLHRAYVVAADQSEARLAFTPGQAVASFFIPFANLVRPYKAMQALLGASDPSSLPLPRVAVANPNASYREPAVHIVETPVRLPRVPVPLWWGFWVGGSVLSRLAADDQTVLSIACALVLVTDTLNIAVVRGIDRCQRERARRLAAMADAPTHL